MTVCDRQSIKISDALFRLHSSISPRLYTEVSVKTCPHYHFEGSLMRFDCVNIVIAKNIQVHQGCFDALNFYQSHSTGGSMRGEGMCCKAP